MNLIFLKFESHVIQNISSQSLQKSNKNGTTSHANRCQNGAKSRSGGDLGSFWAALGVSWASPGSKAPLCRFPGAFWAAFRRFLRCLGRLLDGSWAVLGTKLGRLGASWGHLGACYSDFYGPSPSLSLTSDFDRFRDRF